MTDHEALDRAELAMGRARLYLARACAQGEDAAGALHHLADAREEIQRARWFLARSAAKS